MRKVRLRAHGGASPDCWDKVDNNDYQKWYATL